MSIGHDLRTRRFWRQYLTKSFACFGGISAFIQTNSAINPDVTTFQGISVSLAVVVLSFLGGLLWSWPRPITESYSSPNTKITIVKGDLLEESTHLVIGAVD